jgi:ribosomal protein S17E
VWGDGDREPARFEASGRVSHSNALCFIFRLTNDFHVNKRIIDDVAVIQTKRLRNKIAGYTTHLMKRIQKGPVRGISLKLQEEVRSLAQHVALWCLQSQSMSKFLFNYNRREKERWISSPRSPRSKSRTSKSTETQSSSLSSRTSVSESSSQECRPTRDSHASRSELSRFAHSQNELVFARRTYATNHGSPHPTSLLFQPCSLTKILSNYILLHLFHPLYLSFPLSALFAHLPFSSPQPRAVAKPQILLFNSQYFSLLINHFKSTHTENTLKSFKFKMADKNQDNLPEQEKEAPAHKDTEHCESQSKQATIENTETVYAHQQVAEQQSEAQLHEACYNKAQM